MFIVRSRDVRRAIIIQKIGTNPKTVKQLKELEEEQQKGNTLEASQCKMLFKKARIAIGSTAKWKRSYNPKEEGPRQEGGSQQSTPQGDEAEATPGPTYTSRMLKCTRCCEEQETAWMQLRTGEGFRAIHCKACRLQERCLRNECQCNKVWHHCAEHRVDPATHRSRKAPKKTPEERKKHIEALESVMLNFQKERKEVVPPSSTKVAKDTNPDEEQGASNTSREPSL